MVSLFAVRALVINNKNSFRHEKCFVCSHCLQHLDKDDFRTKNGLLFCPRDLNELYAPRCGFCSQPIEVRSLFSEACNFGGFIGRIRRLRW